MKVVETKKSMKRMIKVIVGMIMVIIACVVGKAQAGPVVTYNIENNRLLKKETISNVLKIKCDRQHCYRISLNNHDDYEIRQTKREQVETGSTPEVVFKSTSSSTTDQREDIPSRIIDMSVRTYSNGEYFVSWETPLFVYDNVRGGQKKNAFDFSNTHGVLAERKTHSNELTIFNNFTIHDGNSNEEGYKAEYQEGSEIYIYHAKDLSLRKKIGMTSVEISSRAFETFYYNGGDYVYGLTVATSEQYLIKYRIESGNQTEKYDVSKLTTEYTIGDVKSIPDSDRLCMYLRNGKMYCTEEGKTEFKEWEPAKGIIVGGFEFITNKELYIHESELDECSFIKTERSCNAAFENTIHCEAISSSCKCETNHYVEVEDPILINEIKMSYAGKKCRQRASKPTYTKDTWAGLSLNYATLGLSSGPVVCSSLISTVGMGANPTCTYNQTDYTLQVELGSGATVTPSDNLIVNGFDMGGNGVVEGLDNSPVRNAFIDGIRGIVPSTVGKCDTLTIDLTKSKRFEHRTTEYKFTHKSGPIEADDTKLLSNSNNEVLYILPENFKNPGTYVIEVKGAVFVNTKFNITSDASTFSFTRTNEVSPRFDILGGTNQTAILGKPFKLIAEPIVNNCSKSIAASFKYTWHLPSGATKTGKFVELTFESIGTFQVSVDVEYEGKTVSKTIWVTTQYPSIEMTFPSGSYRTASASKDLTLDVKVHNILDVKNEKHFKWTCSGFPIISGDKKSSVTFSANDLVAGEKIVCAVEYEYNAELTTKGEIMVQLVEGIVPQVQIVREGASDFVPANQAFVLKSNVTGVAKSAGRIVYNWAVTTSGYNVELEQGKTTLTPNNRPTFALAPSFLIAGAEFEVTLTVSGEKASIIGEGVNRILIKVNKPPTDGTCTVQPSTGDMLTTEFAFACNSWIDEHQPLEYAYSIRSSHSDNFEVVQRFSRKKEFVAFIGLSGKVSVRADIRDALGSIVSVVSNVTVNGVGSENELFDRISSLIDINLKSALKVGDAEESRRLLSQVSSALASITPTDANKVVYNGVKANLLASLSEARSLLIEEESESSVQQQSTIVKNLAAGINPSDINVQENVADFLNTLLDSPMNLESTADIGKSLSDVFGAASQLENSDTQRASVTSKIMNSTIKMVDVIASKQLSGAVPTIVSTSNLQVGVFSSAGGDMSQGTMDLGNGARLSVPDNTVDTDDEVDVSFTVLKNDPHFSIRSKDSAKNLTSSVSRLLFKIGGKEQLVHDRPKPIVFTIPANNDLEKIEANPDEPGIRPQCKYLNTLTNEWETSGCNMTSYTATSTTCECNHATDFGSFLDYVIPNVNILTFDDLKLLTELNTDNMTTLIVLCVMVALYALGLVIFNGCSLACCIGRRLSKRKVEKKKYIFSENQMRGYIRPLMEKMKKSHIWFSIFLKPTTQSSFNSSRRLTIVMVIIFGSLLSNALTFGTKQQNWVQSLLAGVFADVVTMPFIFGFTFLFIKVKPRGYKPPKKPKKTKKISAMEFTPEQEYQFVMKKQEQRKQQMNVENVDEENDLSNTSEVIISTGSTKRLDIVYDKIDEKLKWAYDQYVYMTERVTWYGMAVLFLSTFFYFAAVAGCMAIIYHTIHWFSPELELFIFGTVAVFLYFGALEIIYLSTKARRFQDTNMSWRGKLGWKIQLLVCLFLIVFLLCGQFMSIFFMNALDRNGLPNEWVITIQVGLLACIGLVLIWIFDILRNPKKKEKVSNNEPGFMGRPWFPWYFAYPIYLACWLWMAGSGVALVIYGIKFNKWGQGTDIKWLTSSFVANVQNIFVSKPISFLAKTVVLMAVVRLLESLFFRIRRERKVESA